MALIIVIAVMSGFGKDLRDKILGTNSHIVVNNITGGGINNYGSLIKEVESIEGVKSAAPFILSQVMLTRGERVAGVVIRGINPDLETKASDLEKNLVDGKLSYLKNPPAKNIKNGRSPDGIILGRELSRSLGAFPGDVVSMVSPVARMTPLGLIPKIKVFQVVGLFDSGMYEYDSNLGFIALDASQKIFGMKQQVTGLEIRIHEIDEAAIIGQAIQDKLGFPYHARDWMSMNRNLFSALKMEKVVMFIILILIILVAAFNIISTLFMVVMDKTKDISILKSMGASNKSIMKIFSYQGLIVGVSGTFLGCVGGFTVVPNLNEIVAFLERILNMDIFPKDVYYLSRLPSDIQYYDSFLIIIFSIIICYVASLYPAWRASKLDPVDGLRYE
jgi:lipoprotein-releasing system permease protein